ncbi:hypothetical protein HNY73_009224 [Argiope bruennichi]|uniref:Cuticle protein n=1 Tax=Argiope bruennichi TaxID=94029 RepID=A0A8T0F8V9_ARGBR|nr:hypothetical protein HNY73_009224 [Argiope bruennichi]
MWYKYSWDISYKSVYPDTVKSPIMFAKIVILCAAVVAANASLLAAPLVNTGISTETRQQDAFGNYAYGYDIRDGATGSMNAKAEVGKAAAFAAPAFAGPLAYAAPAIAAPLTYAAPAVAAPAIAAPVFAAPLTYGGIVGRAGVLGLEYGAGLGHGGVYGLRYGAGILGAGFGKALI